MIERTMEVVTEMETALMSLYYILFLRMKWKIIPRETT